MDQRSPRRHTRNPQGSGSRLREDILAAASRILETTGNDDAVTLRAVAREAGITAPAIYAHFADRDAIRVTVITDTFADLASALDAVAGVRSDPVTRLRAVCHAYLTFAADRPHHYRLLFERHRTAPAGDAHQAADVSSILGADAFGVLIKAAAACIDNGASTARSPTAAATRIWLGLHGQATLQASLPGFPWPDRDQLADDVMTRLADLHWPRDRLGLGSSRVDGATPMVPAVRSGPINPTSTCSPKSGRWNRTDVRSFEADRS